MGCIHSEEMASQAHSLCPGCLQGQKAGEMKEKRLRSQAIPGKKGAREPARSWTFEKVGPSIVAHDNAWLTKMGPEVTTELTQWRTEVSWTRQ